MRMSSVSLTNSMRSSLLSLQQTSKLQNTTQNRLATGKKVNSALDDPVNFFSALGHQYRAKDLVSRKDEMGEAIQTIQAASVGVEGIQTLIASAESLAQSALTTEDQSERATLAQQYVEILNQVNRMAEDSNYKGTNLLKGSDQTLGVAFDESGESSIKITGFGADAFDLGLAESSGTGQSAGETVVGFDDLDPDGVGVGDYQGYIPSTYNGLNWSDVGWVDGSPLFPGLGWETGVVSGDHVGFVWATGTVGVDNGTFDFRGVYLTALHNDGQTVTIEGSLGGDTVYSRTVTLDVDQPTWFDFDFNGIDTLTISSPEDWCIMDDFTFTINGQTGTTIETTIETPDWSNDGNIQNDLERLDSAVQTLRANAKTLSANLNIITTRLDFTQTMVNTLEDGAANLTNTDMNEEGANMLMLQTRQALGTTSLSMASQASQSVLRLF